MLTNPTQIKLKLLFRMCDPDGFQDGTLVFVLPLYTTKPKRKASRLTKSISSAIILNVMSNTNIVTNPPEAVPDQSGWVKIGEYTLDHLDGPGTEAGKTRLDEIREHHKALGARTVEISMNGKNSDEANHWNIQNARLGGPKGDNIFSVSAHYPPQEKGREE